MEHPTITHINQFGYPTKEIIIRDKYGDEILPGDSIIKYDGETVLHDNLQRFLESMGFSFIIAE